jgi:hypothetical protein
MIPAFEQAKTLLALEPEATAIGDKSIYKFIFHSWTESGDSFT